MRATTLHGDEIGGRFRDDREHVTGVFEVTIAEMVTRYDRGESLRAIARDAHVAHRTVRTRLLAAGVTLRDRGPRPGHAGRPGYKLSEREVARTVFLRNRCELTLEDVGNALGRSPAAIHERLARRGY